MIASVFRRWKTREKVLRTKKSRKISDGEKEKKRTKKQQVGFAFLSCQQAISSVSLLVTE